MRGKSSKTRKSHSSSFPVPPSVPWHVALEKLDQEVSQLQRLKHPHLVRVYGAGVEDKDVFFATELVDGESLATILSRRGKLAADQVVEYGRQIAEFLMFLHGKDLIHSKLTPEKILITSDHHVKIADLRLNRSKRRRWDATRRRELELAAYMAPEQFTEGASDKSDFYSLGVILFEMLSGQLPYPPDTMGRMTKSKINAPVPSVATQVMSCPIWLDKLITQLLDPDPRKRPHSAKAIAMAFEEIRNIDANKEAAVATMSSGFTPLTAGEDTTEAKNLLREQARAARKSRTPFYQRIWFQAIALLSVVGLVSFLFWQSNQVRIDNVRSLVQSQSPDDWSKARETLVELMDDPEHEQEATELYYDSLQKTLVHRAESGKISRMQDEYLQEFRTAFNLQSEGRDEDAADIFARLVNKLDPEGNRRHIYREAKSRYQALTEKFEWPTDPQELMDMVAATENAESEDELIEAQQMLGRMSIRFAGSEGYESLLQRIDQQLNQIKQQLVERRESADSNKSRSGS